MRQLLLALLALLLAVAPPADAGKGKKKTDGLLRIVTPVTRNVENAHPHLNVIVLFGSTFDGAPADPSTFQAKVRKTDVTSLFTPLVDGEFEGAMGLRAKLDPSMLKVGKGKNVLRAQVRSVPFSKGKRTTTKRDKDKVKFAVEAGDNQAPVVQATADTTLVIPGIPIQFNGRLSADPDFDDLSFAWDFGDGATSTESAPVHVYQAVGTPTITASLTVSDGELSNVMDMTLTAKPSVDDGRTEGILGLSSLVGLEVGVVPIGESDSVSFTISNLDPTPTSQLKVFLDDTNPAFTLDPTSLDLGPGENAPVTITFAPTAEGHADTRIGAVASAMDVSSVNLLTHGYGGSGQDSGPTMAPTTLFYALASSEPVGLATYGIRPDGKTFFADNSVQSCFVPGGGLGTGDACVTNADCSIHGGTCSSGSLCFSGVNAGQPCTSAADCPGSGCLAPQLLWPEDLCGDPHGNLFILSDEGTFTDPDFETETERAATLMRMTLNADGSVAERRILDRPNEESTDIGCDALPAASGRVYLVEYFNVDDNVCFRTEKQNLTAIRKNNGNRSVVISRLDSVAGIDNCNDLEDTASAIAVSADGSTVYANFDSEGIWRARPSPLAFLSSVPDSEIVAIHPDGSLLYAAATDSGTVGFLNVYKVMPNQVATGPLPVSALTPCATIQIPNNGGRTYVLGMAAGPHADDASAASIYMSFLTSGGPAAGVIPSPLRVRGTALFTSAAGSSACETVGLINLETLEQLSY
jgi:PKD repeat protein